MQTTNIKSSDFSADELYSCLSCCETQNWTRELFAQTFENQIERLSNNSYDFSFSKKEKTFFISNENKSEVLFQKAVLRKIYRNIEVEYRFIHPNRDAIISQIIRLTQVRNPYWVLKLDIKSFFESIDRNRIIKKIEQDSLLSSKTTYLIKKIFANQSFNSYTGLPRGLNISSILSEIYLKDFDLEIKRMQGIFYYARYIDDIIIFCTSKSARDCVKEHAKKMLEELHLFLNKKKVKEWDYNSKHGLYYLGYEIKHDEKDIIAISIDPKKIDKIKTRIVKSFINFTKNGDFPLLDKRIKYLSGNCLFKKEQEKKLFTGIYYNYKQITKDEIINELDLFYKKILNCKKGKLGAKLNHLLNSTQKDRLNKYSFIFGYEKHISFSLPLNEIKKITLAWR